MLSYLLRQPVFTVIAIFGCFFILFGFFKVDDITKLAVSPLTQPLYPSILLGVLLIAIGVTLHIVTNLSITTFSMSNVKRLPNGYSVSHGSFVLNVLFGRIETIDCFRGECMIALPANEFFDDECINDIRSALGAYLQYYFKDNIPKIESLVKKLLQNESYQEVEKEPGILAPSYGVGKCIYLDRPLSSQHRIAMVSVTTKRANEGLRASPSYIFNAVDSIQREMANHRITQLYVPVLGSGHGGLKGEISLTCMLIAFTELCARQSGRHLNVNIVVFKRDEKSKSTISDKSIKRALFFTNRLLDE
jgi:hypothetical protein